MHRRLIVLILLSWGVLAWSLQAQSVIYRDTTPHLTVPFLYEAPKIDGRVDFDVSSLPVYQFGTLERRDSTQPFPEANYRLGYGADFLYLYLEVAAAKITYRDRGYQNGDGIVMVISSVEANNQPTREFYVLGFTPEKDTSQTWQRAFTWYHDVDLAMKPLKRSQFGYAEQGDKIGYEVLIPWSELYPYHPWLGTRIGFNLCYAGAVGQTDMNYQMVISDDDIQSEQHARRYTPLTFIYPEGGATRTAVRLERNNIHKGQTINAITAFLADSNVSQDLSFVTRSKVIGACCSRITPMVGTGRVDTSSVYLPTLGLDVGDYSLEWKCGIDSGALDLTVLPPFQGEQAKTEVATLGASISSGSKTTLQFMLQQIDSGFAALRPLATAERLRTEIVDFQSALKEAEAGRDRISQQAGIVRRSFRSRVDNSLQPYSLNVPAGLAPSRAYPLVVYLHGSGQDDRTVLPLESLPDTMFILAPFGRGTSTMYSSDHAQEDILEAVGDVIANYPIDTSRIIIAGFSMGGYGAYRAFYEKPGRYRAIAIFSGHPNLANERSGRTSEPNFLEAKYVQPFKGRDVFIFHGGRDRNCPIEVTQREIEVLKTAGARVTFAFEPAAGHQKPNQESIQKFRDWLAAEVK